MITMTAGDDRTLTASAVLAGAAIDLTGYQVDFVMKGKNSGLTITKSTTSGGIALQTQSGATLGKCTITLDGADTVGVLEEEVFVAEVQIKSPANKRSTIVENEKITVKKQLVTA
jgi:hypothetical protein